MRVVSHHPAADLIRQRGGRLYVWVRRGRCCGSVATLATATRRPPRTEFRQVIDAGEFELFPPAGLARLPAELHLDLRRFPRWVEAYWNGCAWII